MTLDKNEMKKLLCTAFVAITLCGCEQIEKIDAQMDADSTDVDNEIADLKSLGTLERLAKEEHKLIFKASGSEPGWTAEYYTDQFKLLANYGKDSLIIQNISKYFDLDGGYSFSYKNSEAGNEIRLSVKIEDKECTNAAGDKKPKTVTVNFNDKVYTGCGENVD